MKGGEEFTYIDYKLQNREAEEKSKKTTKEPEKNEKHIRRSPSTIQILDNSSNVAILLDKDKNRPLLQIIKHINEQLSIVDKTTDALALIKRVGTEEDAQTRQASIFLFQQIPLADIDSSLLKNTYIKTIRQQEKQTDPLERIPDILEIGQRIIHHIPQDEKTQEQIRNAWESVADKVVPNYDNDPAPLKIARLLNAAKKPEWQIESTTVIPLQDTDTNRHEKIYRYKKDPTLDILRNHMTKDESEFNTNLTASIAYTYLRESYPSANKKKIEHLREYINDYAKNKKNLYDK